MSAIDDAVRQLERAQTPAESRKIIVTLADKTGLLQAVAQRTLSLFASHPARAAQLSSHWPTLEKFGDDPAQANRIRGIHERLRGRWRESGRAFLRAGELSPDPILWLSYQLGAIDAFSRAGDVVRGVELGDRLAVEFLAQGRPDQAGRAYLNTGNALTWADRNVEARDRFERAIPLLDAAGMATDATSARLGLSTAHLYLGDLEQCRVHAELAAAAAEENESPYLAALARVNIAHVHIQSGRPDGAVDLLTRLRADFADSPIDLCRIWEFLGDSLYRLNLWSESAEAYQSALALRRYSTPANVGNCQLGLALCAEADGGLARPLFRSALRSYERIGAPSWESAALSGLARTGGRNALKMALRAIELARRARTPHHEAVACLTAFELSCEHRRLLRAKFLVQRYGLTGLGWRVHWRLAVYSPRPLAHYRRMLWEILAARILQSSMTARASFLRDKETAIREYLSLLLERPTPIRMREAVEVVGQIRSASLVDEILAASEGVLAPELFGRLQALRVELSGSANELPQDSDRPTRQAAAIASTQTADLFVSAGRLFHAPVRPDVAVLVELQDGVAVLYRGKVRRIVAQHDRLEDTLRWLRFELLAPMSDREADPESALCMLRHLAVQFAIPLSDSVEGLCPDGVMFALPWAAMAACEDRLEPVIALHPSFSAPGSRPIDPRGRAVLWWDDKADLPYAEREVAAFLAAFPQAEVCRSAEEVRRSMASPMEVLHVLGHADHNPRNPMFSVLKYADGDIAAREISASSLRVRFANISACSSGALSTVMRHEPDGLVRSFLSRGANAVIGSAWPLDDEAGCLLSEVFYLGLAAGHPIAESLRTARTLLRSQLSHPYFWGCSTLFGGYLS